MGIVKANAYGHGLLQSAHAMLKGGATWLGVAKISEALALRKFLNTDTEQCSHRNTRIFTWIYGPDAPFETMLKADLDLSVTTLWELEKIAIAVKNTGKVAKIHMEVDTGFSRNGYTNIDGLFDKALQMVNDYQNAGLISLEGIWSHFAVSDTPNNIETTIQTKQALEQFENYISKLESNGLEVKYKHIAASAATILLPQSHYNMVRPGIMLYGCSPNPDEIDIAKFGIKPAMKLEVQMNNVKKITANSFISYGYKYMAKTDMSLGIVPLGYSDGIMRSSGGENIADFATIGAPVYVPSDNTTTNIVGRVCMDQFMIKLDKNTNAKAGDWVTLFGFGVNDPHIDDWAKQNHTISYEIMSRITNRAPITHLEAPITHIIPKIQL